VRLAPFLAVRAEGEAAGFLTGGSAEADCLPNASCLSAKTAGGMGGGSALIVVRHPDFPVFAGAGVGTWRTTTGDDRMHGGATYLGGLMLSTRRTIAIEARFNHPSTAIGILTSTLSFALRFSP
jgi:hypothetical protein